MTSTRDIATCGLCRSPILWTITDAGKRMPVNPTADEAGNTAVYKDAGGTLRSRSLAGTASVDIRPHEWRAMPHAATCAQPQPRLPRQTPRPVRRPAAWRYR
jgi:hypothetical protein